VLTVVWDFLALWKRSVGVTTSLLAVEVPALRKVREERGTHDSDVGGEARKAGPPAPHGIYSNLMPHLTLGATKRSTSPAREIPGSTLT